MAKQINTEDVVKVVEETAEKVGKVAEETAEKVAQVAEGVAEEVKKAAPKVAKKVGGAAKKASETVKKTAAKKDMKLNVILQYGEKEISEKDIVAAVKKEWTKGKNKIGDIKTMDLYMKPEDNAVYYVINGTSAGKVEL